MKKVLKIASWAALAALVLFLVAAGALYALVDTQRIKTTVSDLVREQTGRELVFQGEVGLSVFPWLGVELGPVSLSNAPGFGDAPFAEIRRTDVKVKLIPLLSKDIQVRSVLIDGLSLNLARDRSGRTNWDDLAGTSGTAAGAETEDKPAAEGSEASGASAPLLAGLAVGGVSVTHAGLSWTDEATGGSYRLRDVSLTTGPVALGSPFDFSFTATAEAAEPALKGDIRLEAKADPGKDLSKPALNGLKLSVSADGKPLPGGHVDASLGGDILVDVNAGTITVNGLKLSALGLDLSGGLRVERFDTEPVVNASLTFSEFNPKTLMRALGLPEVQTADPKALQSASGRIEATATMDSATLRTVDLKLDDTALTGSAGVTGFAKPAIVFDLAADSVDVNRYLPPEGGQADAKDAAPAKNAAESADKGDSASGLPKETLRALDVDGTLKVGALSVHKLRLKDLSVTVKAKDGLIRITPLSAGLYGGSLKTTLSADLRGDVTRSALALDLSSLGLGDLLKDILGEDTVTGTAKAALKLAGSGEDLLSLAKTLTGNGSLALTNGVFKGFTVIPQAVREQAAQKSDEVAKADVEKQQPFKDISASFKVVNGLVSSDDVTLSADGLGGTGTGTVDLAARTVDYRAMVDIASLPNIPFTIKGDWSDPEISLDTVAFLEETAKSIVNVPVNLGKGVGKVGEELVKGGGKVLEGIGSGILGIFGGKKKEQKSE